MKEKKNRRLSLRGAAARCLTLVLGVCVLLAGAYLLRWPLFGGLVQSAAADFLRDATGTRVEIEGLSGSLLGGIECRVIRGEAEDDRPSLRAFRIEDVRLGYDLRRLLSGDLSGLFVSAGAAAAVVDCDRPGLPARAESSGLRGFTPPAGLPLVDLSRLDLRLVKGERELFLEGCGFRLDAPGPAGSREGLVRADRIILSDPAGRELLKNVRCPLLYRKGRLSIGPAEARASKETEPKEIHRKTPDTRRGDSKNLFDAEAAFAPGSPSRVLLRAGAALLGGRASLEAEVSLDENMDLEADLETTGIDLARASRWLERLAGPAVPICGTLEGKAALRCGLAHPESIDLDTDLLLARAGYGDFPPADAAVRGGFRKGIFRFDRVEIKPAFPTPERCSITAEGEINPDGRASLHAELRGIDPSIAGGILPGGLPAKGMDWDGLEASLDAKGPLAALGGRLAASIARFRFGAADVEKVKIAARLETPRLEVENLAFLVRGGGRVKARAGCILDETAPLAPPESFHAAADIENLNLDILRTAGLPLDKTEGTLDAAIEAKGSPANPLFFVKTHVDGRGLPPWIQARLPLAAGSPKILPPAGKAAGEPAGPAEAPESRPPAGKAAGEPAGPAEAPESRPPAGKEAGEPAGSAAPPESRPPAGKEAGGPSGPAPTLPEPWTLDGKFRLTTAGLEIDSLSLASRLCTLSASGRAPVFPPVLEGAVARGPRIDENGIVEAHLEISGLDLGHSTLAPSLAGVLHGKADLTGPALYPKGRFSLAAENLSFRSIENHRLSLEGLLEKGVLHIRDLRLAGAGKVLLEGDLSLDLNGPGASRLAPPGPQSSFRADLAMEKADLSPYAAALGFPAQGAGSLRLHGGGRLEDPRLDLDFAVDDGRIDLPAESGIAWEESPGVEESPGRDAPSGRDESHGQDGPPAPDQPPSAPFRLEGRATIGGNELVLESLLVESLEGVSLKASGRFPAGLCWARLASGTVVDPDGLLAGEVESAGIDLAGLERMVPGIRRMAGALSAKGTLSGTPARPRWEGRLAVHDGALRVEGDLPTLTDLEAAVEADPGALRIERIDGLLGGGPVHLEGTVGWAGFKPESFDLRLRGDHALVTRGRGIKVRADLDVALTGEAPRPRVTGEAALVDTRIVRRVPLLPGKGPPPVDDRIQPFALGGPLLGGLVFDVALTTRKKGAVLVDNNLAHGEVALDLSLKGTGRVPYFAGDATFNGMLLKLPNFRFRVDTGRLAFLEEDPFIPRIELTARGRRKSYDVDLVVQGPVNSPVVTLSSTPPLSGDALLVLVTTGSLPETVLERGVGNEALQQLGSYLGQELFYELFGSETTEPGGSLADRFDLAIGTEVGRDGTDNVLLEYNMKGPWYLQFERDIYSDVNIGVVYRIRFR